MSKVNIYFGAPLFYDMEKRYNEYVVGLIREKFGDKVNVYLPQENDVINDKSQSADSLDIYHGDTERLKGTDILIAVLDGQTTDIGLATEVGYFARMAEMEHIRGRNLLSILGLYTDIRQGDVTDDKVGLLSKPGESQWSYINLYLIGAIKHNGLLTTSVDSLLYKLEEHIKWISENENEPYLG